MCAQAADACNDDGDKFHSANDLKMLYTKVGQLPGLLPAMLGLNYKLTDTLVQTPFMAGVLDQKLTQPTALLVVLLDGFSICGLIATFLPLVTSCQHHGNLDFMEVFELVLTCIFTLYILLREGFQAISMHRMGRERGIQSISLKSWITDFWNIVDLLVVICVAACCACVAVPWLRNGYNFRGFAAGSLGLAWLKLLGFIKGLSLKFATYVLCLFQIAADIRSFLIVLFLVISAFASMFYLVNMEEVSEPFYRSAEGRLPRQGTADSDEGELDAGALPFDSPTETFLTMYRMMLGDFDRDWFDTPTATIFFLSYTFLVMVMMLNILIAVVSDSYDYAVIRAQRLFLMARLALVAELDTMGLTKAAEPGGAHWWCSSMLGGYHTLEEEEEEAQEEAAAQEEEAAQEVEAPSDDPEPSSPEPTKAQTKLKGVKEVIATPRRATTNKVEVKKKKKSNQKQGVRASMLRVLLWLWLKLQNSVRINATVGDDVEAEEADDWLGRALDMEKRVQMIVSASQDTIEYKMQAIDEKLEKIMQDIEQKLATEASNSKLEPNLQEMDKKLEARMREIDDKMKGINDKLEAILQGGRSSESLPRSQSLR